MGGKRLADIFEHHDYRSYIEAWLDSGKARNASLLARRMGRAPSYVSMVRKGERGITVAQASLWAHAFGLDEPGSAYWANLVTAAQNTMPDQREEALIRIAAEQAYRGAVAGSAAYQLHSSWLDQTILELASCRGFRSDPSWIAANVEPPATVAEVEEAIESLLELGLLVREGEGLRPATGSHATETEVDDAVVSRAVAQLHASALAHAVDCLDSVDSEERAYSTLIGAISERQLPELKEALRRLQIEALESTRSGGKPDRVYQLTMQLLPRTKRLS